MVDMAKDGNPLIARYTEQKITAHYRAYHPGEGYVVGPCRYQWVVRRTNRQAWIMCVRFAKKQARMLNFRHISAMEQCSAK